MSQPQDSYTPEASEGEPTGTSDAPASQRAVFDSNQWFADMKVKANDRHIAEVIAGKHDDVCEWNVELRLCHCHRRKRLAAGIVEAPSLVFQAPMCDGCWEETYHDGDGWVCDSCCARFDTDSYDAPGTWTDEHASTDAELIKWAANAVARRSVS